MGRPIPFLPSGTVAHLQAPRPTRPAPTRHYIAGKVYHACARHTGKRNVAMETTMATLNQYARCQDVGSVGDAGEKPTWSHRPRAIAVALQHYDRRSLASSPSLSAALFSSPLSPRAIYRFPLAPRLYIYMYEPHFHYHVFFFRHGILGMTAAYNMAEKSPWCLSIRTIQ